MKLQAEGAGVETGRNEHDVVWEQGGQPVGPAVRGVKAGREKLFSDLLALTVGSGRFYS